MNRITSITGAIFCGGFSSRMGFPKAGLRLADGKTMIERVYDALRQVCSQVVLVGHGEGVPERLRHLRQIQDRYLFCGPLGALESLLSSDIDQEYLITPCDLASATPELYACLLHEDVQAPAVLMKEKEIEPLVARYSVRQLNLVQRLLSEKRLAMHHLVKAAKAHPIRVPPHLHYALHNVNTPQDLNITLLP